MKLYRVIVHKTEITQVIDVDDEIYTKYIWENQDNNSPAQVFEVMEAEGWDVEDIDFVPDLNPIVLESWVSNEDTN